MKVSVHELDEYFQPSGKALDLDYLDIAVGGFGAGSCMVFRPVGLRVQPGARYLTRVSLDGGKTEAYRYVVEFCGKVGD